MGHDPCAGMGPAGPVPYSGALRATRSGAGLRAYPGVTATRLDSPMRIREPFNAWLSPRRPASWPRAGPGSCCSGRATAATQLLAFAVYGAILILLYAASTVYHALPLGEPAPAAPHARPHRHLLPDRGHLHAGRHGHAARLGRAGPAGGELGHRRGGHPVQDPLAGRAGVALDRHLPRHGIPGAGGGRCRWAAAVGAGGLAWLVAGGIAYTVGAVIFARRAAGPVARACSGTTGSGTCWCWSGAPATSPSSRCTSLQAETDRPVPCRRNADPATLRPEPTSRWEPAE